MMNLKEDCHKLKTVPAADGFHMPAEYEKHHGCLMIWPWRPGSWNYGARFARQAFVQIILKIAESEKVYLFVRKEDMSNAKDMLSSKASSENVIFHEFDTDDAWARDTGATYLIKEEKGARIRRGIDWKFNAWGGAFDGLYQSWEKDDLAAAEICRLTGDECYDASDFVLEGGSIHSDGEGTLITTEECLLSKGRNPHLSKEQIEDKLKNYLGVSKVIWIPEGIYNDETNGHVDNMCAFTAPGEVVLAWTDDKSDPQYDRSRRAYEILSNTNDAKGRKIKVRKLYIPKEPICIKEDDLLGYEFEEGEDVREVGERLAASYVNFYIANKSVLVPQFDDVNDKKAVDLLRECFPNREIVPVPARVILTGGGNIHCITQQIPE